MTANRFHKPFEDDIHSVTDAPGREVVANFISQMIEVDVKPHPDDYDIDLQVFHGRDGRLIAEAEVEVRLVWTEHEYMLDRWGPYLHVPTRKEKFLYGDVPFMFYSVNRNLTGMLWCPGEVIKHSRIGRNMKQKKYFNEKFFKVDWTTMHWSDLREMGLHGENVLDDYQGYLQAIDDLEREKGWGKYKHA